MLNGVEGAIEPPKYTDPSKTLLLPSTETLDRPFRIENELMPEILQMQDEEPLVIEDSLRLSQPEEINLTRAPSLLPPSPQPLSRRG